MSEKKQEVAFLEDYSRFLPEIQASLEVVKTPGFGWIGLVHELGKFQIGEEIIKDFKAVILEIKEYRQKVAEGEDGKTFKECQAFDGRNGTKYGVCAECPYSKFHGDERPECSEYRTLLVRRNGIQEPEQISITASSLKQFFSYVSGLLLGKAGRPAMPVFAVVTEFKAVPQKKGSNKFATIEFSISRAVKDIDALLVYRNEHTPLFLMKPLAPALIEAPKTKVNTVVTKEDGTKEKLKDEVIDVPAEEVADEQLVGELDAKLDELDEIDF